MGEFYRKRETEEFVRRISCHIRDPKIRREVEAEYAAHIEDAVCRLMLEGMREEDAFRQACRALGDPQEYSDLLGDVHAEQSLPPEWRAEVRRQWIVRGLTLVLLIGAVVGATLLWGIFVPQVIVLALSVWVLLWLLRILSALIKRIRALSRLKRTAAETGYEIRIHPSVFTSLLRNPAVPSVQLENRNRVYKIRFLSALKKNMIFRFVGPNMYVPARMAGAMMLNHRHPFLGIGLFGAVPPARILYTLHSDFAEFASGVRILPTLERRFDDKTKTVEEVLIFNPAPMQVRYRRNSTETVILGGETVDGIQLHDIVSFCSMLQRTE